MQANEFIALWLTTYAERETGRYPITGMEAGRLKAFIKNFTDKQLELLVEGYFEFRGELFPPARSEGYTLNHFLNKWEAVKQCLKARGSWEEEE